MQSNLSFSPRISVALVTRNRPESLLRTLHSLAAQDVQPWEVLVSDDSDDAHTLQTRKIAEQFGCRYLRGPRHGLYANRNHAALACTGTHVRTMDDDHEFPVGHFRLCLDAVRRDPEAIWIIGEKPAGEPEAGYRCPGQLHPRGFSSPPPNPDDCWAIADGGSMYPASIFQRGIRYAEYYKFGAAYLEFGSRLHWLGYRMRFLSSTWIDHHHDPRERSFMDQQMERSARFFAVLCHSFLYRPAVYNKLLTTLQITREVALHGGYASWCSALAAYRDHKRNVLEQSSAEPAAATSLLATNK